MPMIFDPTPEERTALDALAAEIPGIQDTLTRNHRNRRRTARMLAYRASQKHRGALADDQSASFFEKGRSARHSLER